MQLPEGGRHGRAEGTRRFQRIVQPPGARGALLQLHRDTPTQWDAWDIDDHYRRHTTDLVAADVVELVSSDPGRAAVRVVRSFA